MSLEILNTNLFTEKYNQRNMKGSKRYYKQLLCDLFVTVYDTKN